VYWEEEEAIEREEVRDVKVKEFGKKEMRGMGEKGRALSGIGRKNVEILVNGVTIVFILREHYNNCAKNFLYILIFFVLSQIFVLYMS